MRYLQALALLLVIVGGVNWLLVGIAKVDLVAALTGASFGETNAISTVVYVLVGPRRGRARPDPPPVGHGRLVLGIGPADRPDRGLMLAAYPARRSRAPRAPDLRGCLRCPPPPQP